MSYEVLSTSISAAVTTGGTVSFPFPSGRADGSYTPGSERLRVPSTRTVYRVGTDFTVQYTSKSAVITWLNTLTIPALQTLQLELTVNDDTTTVSIIPPAARKLNKITYMHNGSPAATVSLGAVRTHMTAVRMPDDCYAVRFGIANITNATYAIGGIAYSASDSMNDYIAPTGNHGWLYSTWNSAGVDLDDYVFPGASSIQASTALANATHPVTGATDIPKVTWTDWNLLAVNTPRDPASATPRYLFARCLTNLGTLTRISANNTGFTGVSSANLGWDFATMYSAADRVTTITNGGAVDTFTIFYVIQFLCRRPGTTVMITGTSTHQGYTPDNAGSNIAFFASNYLQQQGYNVYPANVAWGGSDSDRYWPIFNNLIGSIQPGICLIPAYNSNDTPVSSKATVDKMVARALQMADAARKQGAIPIMITPNLRDSATMAAVTYTNWKYARDATLALRKQGMYVFDWAGALLYPDTTPEAVGGILATSLASSDVTHASVASQQKMGLALSEYLKQFLST